MGRYTGRLLAMLGIAVLASAFVSTALAGAQVYPPITTTTTSPPPTTTTPPPTTTLAPPTTTTTLPGGTLVVPNNVVVGGSVAVSGTASNQTVIITFNGAQVATATTDASGAFSTSFNVPAGTTPGTYAVTASNSICVLSASVVVDPAAAAKLAFTGSSSSVPTLWVGAGLVALGAGLVFVARRRLSGAAR